jgi:hypothetical protein
VDELFRSNRTSNFGKDIFHDGTRLASIQVWGAYTDDRKRDEKRMHERLSPYLVPEFGREIFAAPLPAVLDALADIVSAMIEQYAWSMEFLYRDASKEVSLVSATYGYPLTTRASLERATNWHTKKTEEQTEKRKAMQQQIEELQKERDQLKAVIDRLTPPGDRLVRH